MRVPGAVSDIRRYVRSAEYRAYRSKYVLAAIDRLVKHVDVFPVWEGLSRKRYPTLPVDFIVACSGALEEWEHMPRRGDKAIERDLAKFADDAESLADRLDQHADEVRFCGIRLVLGDYLQELSDAQRGKVRLRPRPIKLLGKEAERQRIPLHYRIPFRDEDGNVVWPAQIQSLLRELARRFRSPDKVWRSEVRPTKRGAKDAERTFLVRSVVYFFRSRVGAPHWDWVAQSVTAMTDSEGIDAGHAQKLAHDVRALWSSAAEERLWESRLFPKPEDEDYE